MLTTPCYPEDNNETNDDMVEEDPIGEDTAVSESFPDGTQVELLSASGQDVVLIRHGSVGVMVSGTGQTF